MAAKRRATGTEAEPHPKQRRVQVSTKKWWFEILENQCYGCPSCRFIYNGCAFCQSKDFKGKRAVEMWYSEPYQEALFKLENGWEIAGEDDDGYGDDGEAEEFEVPESEEVKPRTKVPLRRLRSKQ